MTIHTNAVTCHNNLLIESNPSISFQMPWSINTIPVQHSLSQAPGASPPPPPRSSGAPQQGTGISPSLSISSIPASNSSAGLGSLNISPTTNNNNSNSKKCFVKTTSGAGIAGNSSSSSSGNISKSSDSGHVIDHHARGPTTATDVIGLSSRNGGAGGVSAGLVGNLHYENYLPLPPPSAASQMLAAAEEQRRVRIERDRIIMADREREQQHQQQIEGDQLRMQHRHREREKEIERMRHLEQQQRASYYATAGAVSTDRFYVVVLINGLEKLVGWLAGSHFMHFKWDSTTHTATIYCELATLIHCERQMSTCYIHSPNS